MEPPPINDGGNDEKKPNKEIEIGGKILHIDDIITLFERPFMEAYEKNLQNEREKVERYFHTIEEMLNNRKASLISELSDSFQTQRELLALQGTKLKEIIQENKGLISFCGPYASIDQFNTMVATINDSFLDADGRHISVQFNPAISAAITDIAKVKGLESEEASTAVEETPGPKTTITNEKDGKVLKITKFSEIKSPTYYTDNFELYGSTWRLLLYPNGKSVNCLSLYLFYLGPLQFCDVRYTIEVINQKTPKYSITRGESFQFNIGEDRGYTQFMPLSKLFDVRSGFLKDDTLAIKVKLEILPPNWNYDSKMATGYVGLKYQGTMGYMNSLLQVLFHIPMFRQAVYQLPVKQAIPGENILLYLQRIFCKLQLGNKGVKTEQLTESIQRRLSTLGTRDFRLELLDYLRSEMEGTAEQGTIEKLFQGQKISVFKYLESNLREAYLDISLDVKGCTDVIHSFEKYTEPQILDGNNNSAEGHDLQTTIKEIKFLSFPPVLHLHLKRFPHDHGGKVTVYDRYTFPEVLDLTKFLAKDAPISSPAIFHLHGVVVHSGDIDSGYYREFIRPTAQPEWFKFSYELVTRVTLEQIKEDAFGGKECESSAHMLVYLRDSDVPKLIAPIPNSDIPTHLEEYFEEEKAKKQEKKEVKLNTSLLIVTDTDFRRMRNKCDLVDFSNANLVRVRKACDINEYKGIASEIFGIPPERQRYWTWTRRQNRTFRPYESVQEYESFKELEHAQECRLYLEETPPYQNSPVHSDDVLIFLKYYDPLEKLLQYVGHAVVRSSTKVFSLVPLVNGMVGNLLGTPLLVFEEVKPDMVDPLQPNLTLNALEIATGDILVFQRALTVNEQTNLAFTSIQDHYNYIRNLIIVQFRSVDANSTCTLELHKELLYDQITAKLAAKLGTDPTTINLLRYDSYDGIHIPIESGTGRKLFGILMKENTTQKIDKQ